MRDLPKGWTQCKLESLVNVKYGKNLPTKNLVKDGQYRVFGANGVIGYYDQYLYKTEQVLISCRGANSGAINYSPPMCFITNNSLVLELVNDDLVVKRFLYYAVQSVDRSQLVTGTAQPQVTIENAAPLQIPLAPLNEQRRIVAKLEKLLPKVNACGDRLDKIPTLLKRFRQSVLAAACSGRLTADWREQHPTASSWKKENLINLIQEKPRNGFSGKSVDLVDYETNTKVLTLTATTSGTFRHDCFKYLAQDISLDSHAWLHPTDILIQRGNTIEYVGVSAIYTGEPFQFIYPDLMMKIRVKKEIADHRFIYFALSDIKTRNYFRDNATGTAGNMPKINQQVVMNTPIHLPSLAEQEEIVRRVQALFQKCDQIEARYQKAKAYTDKLTQAILAKAFRGELVPQDPNDEPAEVLLERIRRDKEATATAKPKKTTKKRGKKASSPQQTIPGME